MNITLTDRLFCFSEDEFIVLADACGVHTVYGFDMRNPQFEKNSEGRYNRTVVNLYKKSVLFPQKTKFVIDDEVEKIFECIGNTKYILKLIYCDGEKAPVCIYPGKTGNVYVCPAADGVDYISIGIKQVEPLGRFLKESGYLPMAETSSEIMSLREENGDEINVPDEVFESIRGMFFYGVLIENATRKVMKRIAVVQDGMKEIMVAEDADGNRGGTLYTKERFIKRICENVEV